MKLIKNKQIKEIILRTSANYIIALDALNKAHDKDILSVEQYADAVQHITDNSIEIASAIGGLKGIAMINDIINNRNKNYYEKNNKVGG